MTDWFLEDKDRLNNQPKKTIGDYVESEGFPVAKRFNSLDEARKSHKEILLRSEHIQEYDGISGLLNSFKLSSNWIGKYRGLKSIKDVKEEYFRYNKESNEGTPLFLQYCMHLNKSLEEFKNETSFSIWENVKGYNRTIVADSSIKNLFHVMTFLDKKGKYLFNYTLFEKGKKPRQFVKKLPSDLEKGLEKIIGSYENIRSLDKFDSNHCPIMEFQTSGDKDFFLQYHRTRDFCESPFILEKNKEKDEINVLFVRGHTKPEGEELKVTVHYKGQGNSFLLNAGEENGSFDLHYNHVFSGLQFKKRDLQIMDGEDLDWEMMKLVVRHSQRSKLFKPKISIIQQIEPLLKKGETTTKLYKKAQKENNSYINVYFISDGRKAFIKRI